MSWYEENVVQISAKLGKYWQTSLNLPRIHQNSNFCIARDPQKSWTLKGHNFWEETDVKVWYL